MTRTPTQGKLNDTEGSKSLKRNTTTKNVTEKTNPLIKSSTKANLSAVKTTEKSKSSTKEITGTSTPNQNVTVNTNTNTTQQNGHHPTRSENISGVIGVETQNINNDELLTKEDPMIVSSFQDKTEMSNVNNVSKIDYNEVLEDKWSCFSK
jgi:hypothetical protein